MLEAFGQVNLSALPSLLASEDVRARMFEHARNLGLPTRRLEAWHYTDLSQLLRREIRDDNTPLSTLQVSDRDMTVLSGPLDDDAMLRNLPDGVCARSIFSSLDYLRACEARDGNEAMTALNLALLAEGLEIKISGNVSRPLCLMCDGSQDRHIRHHIHLEKETKLTLVEICSGTHFVNAVNDIKVSEGAHLTHIRVQKNDKDVCLIRPELEANARYDLHVFALGAGVSRQEVRADLNGTNAQFNLGGAILAPAGAHHDITSVISHNSADTHSQTLVRSLVSQAGRGVFQGKIFVARDAQKVTAEQQSKALLLAQGAEVNVKPELEIYADDVACSHGSTMGDLDQNALFFLRSRGISEIEARRMLIDGFINDIVEQVGSERLQQLIHDSLEADLNRLGHGGNEKGDV